MIGRLEVVNRKIIVLLKSKKSKNSKNKSITEILFWPCLPFYIFNKKE